jgi:hypothetical protein
MRAESGNFDNHISMAKPTDVTNATPSMVAVQVYSPSFGVIQMPYAVGALCSICALTGEVEYRQARRVLPQVVRGVGSDRLSEKNWALRNHSVTHPRRELSRLTVLRAKIGTGRRGKAGRYSI